MFLSVSEGRSTRLAGVYRGGNLCCARGANVSAVRAQGPARNASWRPMVFQRRSPRLLLSLHATRAERETLRVRSFVRPDVLMTIRVCISLCAVAPVKGGGGPRVLGRAARLIEGPIPLSSFGALLTLLRRAATTNGPSWCVVAGWLAGGWTGRYTGSGRERVRERTAERGRGEKMICVYLSATIYILYYMRERYALLLNVTKRRSRTLKENDYPERWITWLVGR